MSARRLRFVGSTTWRGDRKPSLIRSSVRVRVWCALEPQEIDPRKGGRLMSGAVRHLAVGEHEAAPRAGRAARMD